MNRSQLLNRIKAAIEQFQETYNELENGAPVCYGVAITHDHPECLVCAEFDMCKKLNGLILKSPEIRQLILADILERVSAMKKSVSKKGATKATTGINKKKSGAANAKAISKKSAKVEKSAKKSKKQVEEDDDDELEEDELDLEDTDEEEADEDEEDDDLELEDEDSEDDEEASEEDDEDGELELDDDEEEEESDDEEESDEVSNADIMAKLGELEESVNKVIVGLKKLGKK